jgi:hypothetical protein
MIVQMTAARKQEMRPIFKFIATASPEECALIIEEIRCVHDNIGTWNEAELTSHDVKSVCLNDGCIQLNVETTGPF